MKVALNIQYGKAHLSYRGLMCANQDNTLEGHEMLKLATDMAIKFEEMGHLAFVLAYGSMQRRAQWVNRIKAHVAIGLSLTKTSPAILYAKKFDPEGEKAKEIAEYLNEAYVFSTDNIKYKVFPLRERTSKLALVSYFNPERVDYAFVLSPFSCASKPYFLHNMFIKAFTGLLIAMFDK